MSFTALIPARLASTRLPRKPLADIAGVPMVVRVARQAQRSGASQVVVAADDEAIVDACRQHGVQALLTRADHASGSDRLAEACVLLGLDGDDLVVNVQGDEPLIEPALIARTAAKLNEHEDCVMSTAAHAIDNEADFHNPNIVKVVLDAAGRALYFSRAAIPCWRDAPVAGQAPNRPTALRHIGLYAYRAGDLKAFAAMPPGRLEQIESLEQLRVLEAGWRIAVRLSPAPFPAGVDTEADLLRVEAALAAR